MDEDDGGDVYRDGEDQAVGRTAWRYQSAGRRRSRRRIHTVIVASLCRRDRGEERGGLDDCLSGEVPSMVCTKAEIPRL